MKKIRKLIVIFSLIVCLGLCGAGGIVLSGLGSPELAENGGGNSESEEFKPADPGDIKIPETTSNASGDWSNYCATGYAGGSGTQSDPFRIETAAQLAYLCLKDNYNNHPSSMKYGPYYFKLTKHIDLSAHYWNTAPSCMNNLQQINFDGGSHTIYGLTSTSGYGLFGNINDGRGPISVHDFLISVNITGVYNTSAYSLNYVGAVISSSTDNYGSIKNVGVYGTINSAANYCGGIIGRDGETTWAAGDAIVIENCFNKANITSTKGYAGGIVGYLDNNNSFRTDNIVLHDCYNTGNITGNNSTGGIIGNTFHTSITRCYNTGTIKSNQGNSYAGGIVGHDTSYEMTDDDTSYPNRGTSITNCFNEGSVYHGIIGGVNHDEYCTSTYVSTLQTSSSSGYLGCGGGLGNYMYYHNKGAAAAMAFNIYSTWDLGTAFSSVWHLENPLTLPVHNWYLKCANLITLNKNGGSNGTSSFYNLAYFGNYSNAYLTSSISSVSVPTRSGCSFKGYYTSSTGGTQCINSSGTILSTADPNYTTWYAQWNKTNIRTITLNKNGGHDGSNYIYYWNGGWYSDQACESAITDVPTLPEMLWYQCDGYYSSSSGGTQYVNSSGEITRSSVSSNETWYAHWSKDASQALTITLTDHGGSGGKGEIYFWNTSYYSDAACSTSITTVTKPGKTGYAFAGYYSAASGGTQNVDGTGKITKTSVSVNEEWHAHWDADYNHIYITIKSKGFTDAAFASSATGGTVTVTGYTDSNGTAIESTSQVTTASGDVQCMVGYSVTVSAAANGGYTLLYLGTDANWDISKTLSTANWTDANTSKGDKNVYAYFIQEPGNKVKYDSVKKYYYFENGEFPQAYVGDETNKTLQSANLGSVNYTISTAWGNIPVYTYNSHKYAMLTATSAQTIKTSKGTLTTTKDAKYFFEVQPIRWMVKSSDWTQEYAYNSNFVGVTADILLFSSVNTSNLNYNKDFSTTTLQSTLNGIITNANLNDFAASVSYKTEYFNNTSTTLVKESATSVTGKMRVVSTSDLEAVDSWQATASDLALFMYSSKMGANSDTAGNMAYWTRNLGTYLNNGTIVTATGNTKNNHLTEFNGVRFAITFTSGGRFGI